jgi:hypothetical protein
MYVDGWQQNTHRNSTSVQRLVYLLVNRAEPTVAEDGMLGTLIAVLRGKLVPWQIEAAASARCAAASGARRAFRITSGGLLLAILLVLGACTGGNNSAGRQATQTPAAAISSPAPTLSTPDVASPAPATGTPAAAARSPVPVAGSPTPAAVTARVASPTVTSRATAATAGSLATPADPASRAVMAVIQRANAEQQQALAQHDPSVMRDTATPAYFTELAQTLSDLQQGGVTAIKLISLQWGGATIQGTNARATTTETWQSTYSDSSTEQSTDLNVYSLVQQGSAWLIAADAHPNTRLNQPGPGAGAGGSAPSPVPEVPGASQSRNWAGYMATGGPFTAVSGTWTVPRVNAGGNAGSADATWVGIGGVTSRDLIQAGTEATAIGPGQVRYSAWVERLPQPSQTVPLSVSPGDVIAVTITQQAGNTWQISMVNQTSGQQYQTTLQYTSSLSSVEWIEEAPAAASAGLRIITLDDFGQVQIQGASAVEAGQQVTIAQAGGKPTSMYGRGGQPLAQPSPLSADGASFTVTRVGGSGPVVNSGVPVATAPSGR